MAAENRDLKEKLDSIKTAQFVWMTYCLLSQAAGCLAPSLDLQPQPKIGQNNAYMPCKFLADDTLTFSVASKCISKKAFIILI